MAFMFHGVTYFGSHNVNLYFVLCTIKHDQCFVLLYILTSKTLKI